QTGGYHIFSSLRFLAGADAVRATGLAMDRPIPRVNASDVRQYTSEAWEMGILDFANGAVGLMGYSPLYHAHALRRQSKTLFQIDGTTGTIVEDEVHLTTEEQRLNGGQATVYPIRAVTREDGGVRVLERMEIESEPSIVWENPFPRYRLGVGSLAILE